MSEENLCTPLLEPLSAQNVVCTNCKCCSEEVGKISHKIHQDLEVSQAGNETPAPKAEGVIIENQKVITENVKDISGWNPSKGKSNVDKLQRGMRFQNERAIERPLLELKENSNLHSSHRKKVDEREKSILIESLRILQESTSQNEINDGFAGDASFLLQVEEFAPRKRRKPKSCIVVIALFLTTFSDYTLLSLWPPLVPYIYSSRSIEEKVAMYTVKPLAQTLLSLYMGRHNHGVLGPAQKVTIGLIALGTAAFLFANSTSFKNVLLARALHGFGSALSITGGMALMAVICSDNKSKHEKTGLIMSGVALGVVIGPILGLLTVDISIQVPFFLVATLLCIAFLLVLIFFCCMYDELDHESAQIAGRTTLNGDGNVDISSTELKRCIRLNPYAVYLGICILIGNIIMSLIEVTIPPYVKNNYNLGPRQFCLIWIVIPLSYLTVAAAGRYMLNKLTYKWKILSLGFAFTTVGLPLVVSPYIKVESSVSTLVDIKQAIQGVNAHIVHDISAALGYIVGPFLFLFVSPTSSNGLLEIFYVFTFLCFVLALSSTLFFWRNQNS